MTIQISPDFECTSDDDCCDRGTCEYGACSCDDNWGKKPDCSGELLENILITQYSHKLSQ